MNPLARRPKKSGVRGSREESDSSLRKRIEKELARDAILAALRAPLVSSTCCAAEAVLDGRFGCDGRYRSRLRCVKCGRECRLASAAGLAAAFGVPELPLRRALNSVRRAVRARELLLELARAGS